MYHALTSVLPIAYLAELGKEERGNEPLSLLCELSLFLLLLNLTGSQFYLCDWSQMPALL